MLDDLDYSEKSQLRNLTCDEIIRALERDGFERAFGGSRGKPIVYRKQTLTQIRRVAVHYHPKKTYYNINLLITVIFACAGWTKEDLYRLRILKRKRKS